MKNRNSGGCGCFSCCVAVIALFVMAAVLEVAFVTILIHDITKAFENIMAG